MIAEHLPHLGTRDEGLYSSGQAESQNKGPKCRPEHEERLVEAAPDRVEYEHQENALPSVALLLVRKKSGRRPTLAARVDSGLTTAF